MTTQHDRPSPIHPVTYRPHRSSSVVRQKSTKLRDKLWERLEIEEDDEPMWYLLNCVAGLELDLRNQCREVCRDMPEVVRFIVPTERKTRSHGANRMVTETKVKYLGYVFAKLRLCQSVYEAVQSLDLCRSWMGTVNHKGYKKLPPAPLALNELEIEKFGLEEWQDEDESGVSLDGSTEADDVIVDTKDDSQARNSPQVDESVLKQYLGLKVDDMVKVTGKGKFYNEDGIVRRLKEGKIFVRFYTYGSMFEEWLQPTDVRKLSNEEVLRGLSGPSQPITQREFDRPSRTDSYDTRSQRNSVGNFGSPYNNDPSRNRRQDRTQQQYRYDNLSERSRDRKNWEWYKTQQDGRQGYDASDDTWNMRAGTERQSRGKRKDQDWDALSDVDGQWGRQKQPQRRDTQSPNSRGSRDSRDRSAVYGTDDWSAFVGPTLSGRDPASNQKPNDSSDDDDFFASLIDDLSDSLEGGVSSEKASSPKTSKEDDFFDSLMSELTNDKENGDESMTNKIDDGDDFFASLAAEVNAEKSKRASRRRTETVQSSQVSPVKDDEDFFASLEKELGDSNDPDWSKEDKGSEDFFASLEKDDDFFSSLANDLDDMLSPSSPRTGSATSSSPSKSEGSASSTQDYSTMTVSDLKDMLRERGLKVSGKKSELIERLMS